MLKDKNSNELQIIWRKTNVLKTQSEKSQNLTNIRMKNVIYSKWYKYVHEPFKFLYIV